MKNENNKNNKNKKSKKSNKSNKNKKIYIIDKIKQKKGLGQNQGSIEIIFMTVLVLAMFVILGAMYILYTQINSYIYPIKQDIFYIVQNAYLSLDKENLSYFEYKVDEEKLRDKVSYIFSKNYDTVTIDKLSYNDDQKKVDIVLNVKIKPLVLSKQIGIINLKLKSQVKLKMMEVE